MFLLFQTLSRKKYCAFQQKFCGTLVKTCDVGVHWIISETFSLKLFFFFFCTSVKFYGPSVENFLEMPLKNWFYSSKKLVWQIICFLLKKKLNLLNVLWHLAKNCRPLAEKFFLRDCQNCNRSVHRRVLRIFLKNLYCYHPLELIEKKSAFYTNLSGTIVKTALQVFMGIFWGKSEKIFLFLQLLSALEWRKFAM